MIISLRDGKPLSSYDLLFLGERMFGERMLLTFFMHSKRNHYSQNRARRFLAKLETRVRCSETRVRDELYQAVWPLEDLLL